MTKRGQYIAYDPELLEEIASNINLADYIGRDIELTQKTPRELFGRCPLHSDRTPSFTVTPSKNRYYCFGCSRGGGIFQYMMDFQGMTFPEAVKKASEIASVPMEGRVIKSQSFAYMKSLKTKKDRMTGSIKAVNHSILSPTVMDGMISQPAIQWVDEGIGPAVQEIYGIVYDPMKRRICYPVYDMDGNLINIKGRTTDSNFKEKGIPKYINYYAVGSLDYFQGWQQALEAVKETGNLTLFESIKSCMLLHQAGEKDCMSVESHCLTKEQVKWIISQPFIKQVTIAFDSDVDIEKEKKLKGMIDILKRFVAVYVVVDDLGILGGPDAKKSPVDNGYADWMCLRDRKKKVR